MFVLITERKFYNLQNWLDSNQRFCKSFQTKKSKENKKRKKRKVLEKGKGRRLHFGLDTENGPRPISLLPRIVFFFSPLGH
jgi:hypothetical protein